MSIQNCYIGIFESINWTAASAVSANAIHKDGSFIGVTRQKFDAGDLAVAFLPAPVHVWDLPLAAAAVSAVSRGTQVNIDSNDKVVTSGGTALGLLWKAIAVGDTTAQVAFYAPTPSSNSASAALVTPTADAVTDSSGGTASTTIAAIGATYAQAEVANAIASLASQIAKLKADNAALISALQTAGLMATT